MSRGKVDITRHPGVNNLVLHISNESDFARAILTDEEVRDLVDQLREYLAQRADEKDLENSMKLKPMIACEDGIWRHLPLTEDY